MSAASHTWPWGESEDGLGVAREIRVPLAFLRPGLQRAAAAAARPPVAPVCSRGRRESQEFECKPLPPHVRFIDIYSDPVEGLTMMFIGETRIGGACANDRLSGECPENEYRSVGHENFGRPGTLVVEGLTVMDTWRVQPLNVKDVERAEILYRRTYYGAIRVFELKITPYGTDRPKSYGITQEEYETAYRQQKPHGPISRSKSVLVKNDARRDDRNGLTGVDGMHGEYVDDLNFYQGDCSQAWPLRLHENSRALSAVAELNLDRTMEAPLQRPQDSEESGSPRKVQSDHASVGISYCRTDPQNKLRCNALAAKLTELRFRVAIDTVFVNLSWSQVLGTIFGCRKVILVIDKEYVSFRTYGVQQEFDCAVALLYDHSKEIVPVIFHDFDEAMIPVQIKGHEYHRLDARVGKNWDGLESLMFRLHGLTSHVLPGVLQMTRFAPHQACQVLTSAPPG